VSTIDDALREELSALLDGMLPEAREAELRARMETDAALLREFEELQKTVALVRGLPQERAPDALRERLRVALPPARKPAPIFRWIGSQAAAAAVAGVAFFLLQSQPPSPRPSTPSTIEARQELPEVTAPAPAAEPVPVPADDFLRDRAAPGKAAVPDKAPVARPQEKLGLAAVESEGDAEEAVFEESRKQESGESRRKGGARDDAKTVEGLLRKKKPSLYGARKELDEIKLLLTRIERGAAVQEEQLRFRYFVQLDGAESKQVVEHIDGFAPTYPRGAQAAALPPVYVISGVEARQITDILTRAYPVAQPDRGKRGAESASRASLASSVSTANQSEMRVEFEANTRELAQIRSWLAAISIDVKPAKKSKAKKAAPRGARAPASAKAMVETKDKQNEDLPRRRYRLRIVLPKPTPAPARK